MFHCWSSANRWSSPTPSNPSAYPLRPTSSLRAWPAGSQAGARSEKEVLCANGEIVVRTVGICCCLFTATYYTIYKLLLLILDYGWPTLQLCFFLLPYPTRIKLTSHSSPILPHNELFISVLHLPYQPALFFSSSFSFNPLFFLSSSSHFFIFPIMTYSSTLPPFFLSSFSNLLYFITPSSTSIHQDRRPLSWEAS